MTMPTKVKGIRLDEFQRRMLQFSASASGSTEEALLRSTIRANFIAVVHDFIDDPAVTREFVAVAVNTAHVAIRSDDRESRATYEAWLKKLHKILDGMSAATDRKPWCYRLGNHIANSPVVRAALGIGQNGTWGTMPDAGEDA